MRKRFKVALLAAILFFLGSQSCTVLPKQSVSQVRQGLEGVSKAVFAEDQKAENELAVAKQSLGMAVSFGLLPLAEAKEMAKDVGVAQVYMLEAYILAVRGEEDESLKRYAECMAILSLVKDEFLKRMQEADKKKAIERQSF